MSNPVNNQNTNEYVPIEEKPKNEEDTTAEVGNNDTTLQFSYNSGLTSFEENVDNINLEDDNEKETLTNE